MISTNAQFCSTDNGVQITEKQTEITKIMNNKLITNIKSSGKCPYIDINILKQNYIGNVPAQS